MLTTYRDVEGWNTVQGILSAVRMRRVNGMKSSVGVRVWNRRIRKPNGCWTSLCFTLNRRKIRGLMRVIVGILLVVGMLMLLNGESLSLSICGVLLLGIGLSLGAMHEPES